MKYILDKTLVVFSATALLGGMHFPAVGQESAGLLEEIIITAQRREQSLQDVPVAVTALGPEQMELKQVANIADLQYQVPNISLSTNTGTANGAAIFLRGVGESESRASADPAVGIYVDGIYIGRQVGALFDLVDLERIEVLRGPQGTLYGRNSNGGAIKLVSTSPQFDDNTLDIKVTVGSDSRLDTKLTANLAISDATAVRGTLLTKSRDGFHTLNPNGAFAAQAGTEVGEIDTQAVRLAVSHNFSDSWNANLTFDYTDDQSDPVPDSIQAGNDADNNLFTIEPLPGTTCSAATSAAIGCLTNFSSDVETMGLAIDISGDIGEYTFRSLTGYRELEDELFTRISNSFTQQTDQEQLSQELTLTSNYDGPFNFVTGLYYFSEDVQLDTIFFAPFELGVETDALAVFFQSTYAFNDTLTLTTGVRYTDETKDVDGVSLLGTRKESRDFTNTTYTVSLNNQFTDNVMGYVSLASGFKSGGWSPDCFPGPCFAPVDEEELDSFEIGIRSDLFDNRLRLNLTYFYNQYDGLQVSATVPGQGFTRFGVSETEISGFEAEIVWNATDNLAFNATLGTIDGEYKDLTLDEAGGVTNDGASPGCGGVVSIECAKRLDLKNAPDYKGTVGVVHRVSLSGGILTTGIDLLFEDESYNLVANDPPHAQLDVDTLVNARIAFESDSGEWQVALWGKNLTDEEYARASTAGSFALYASEPLTWGVDFGYRF